MTQLVDGSIKSMLDGTSEPRRYIMQPTPDLAPSPLTEIECKAIEKCIDAIVALHVQDTDGESADTNIALDDAIQSIAAIAVQVIRRGRDVAKVSP